MTYEHGEAACDIFRSILLVDDLERSIASYQKIGFMFGEPCGRVLCDQCSGWTGTSLEESAQEQRDRQHRRNNDHLDASAGVDGIETFYFRRWPQKEVAKIVQCGDLGDQSWPRS
jgi:hypothetical protein